MKVVAGWKPERAAVGFVSVGFDMFALEARSAAGTVVEALGLTGRGGLKEGPLRRVGAALGGIATVRTRSVVSWCWAVGLLHACSRIIASSGEARAHVPMSTRYHVPSNL